MRTGPGVVVAVIAALVSSGCDALLTEPAPATPELSVSFAVEGDGGGGSARAFERVDRVFLRFGRPDSARRDTVIRLAPRGGTARFVSPCRPRSGSRPWGCTPPCRWERRR